MKLSLILMSILLLVFSGCSQRVIVEKEIVCVEQYLIPQPKVNLRVHKDDVEIAKTYVEANNQGYEYYEEQVKRNNNLCVSQIRNNDRKDKTEETKR